MYTYLGFPRFQTHLQPPMNRTISFFGESLSVYKAALHTHSTVSEDGILSPDTLIGLYRAEGYDCLAFTDHRRTNHVSSYNGKGMTLISGVELHPIRRVQGELWHLLALGVPEDFPVRYTFPKQAAEAVHAAGGLLFMPHPYWTGFGSRLLASIPHVLGIEVFNGAVREVGKAYNMESWDEMLMMGRDYTALAVDDVHHDHDLFRGWTMVCSRDRSAPALLRALRRGDFYASCGPEFRAISCHDGVFEAEFTPCVAAQLCGPGRKGYRGHFDRTTRQAPALETVTHLKVDISNLKPSHYVRCQLTDADGRMAWSCPIRRTGPGPDDFRRAGCR